MELQSAQQSTRRTHEEYDLQIRGLPSAAGSDCYLLRAGPGVLIPPHVDAAKPGFEHHRLNVALSDEHEGGDVTIEGAKVELHLGDALVFRPDIQLHAVSEVTAGPAPGLERRVHSP